MWHLPAMLHVLLPSYLSHLRIHILMIPCPCRQFNCRHPLRPSVRWPSAQRSAAAFRRQRMNGATSAATTARWTPVGWTPVSVRYVTTAQRGLSPSPVARRSVRRRPLRGAVGRSRKQTARLAGGAARTAMITHTSSRNARESNGGEWREGRAMNCDHCSPPRSLRLPLALVAVGSPLSLSFVGRVLGDIVIQRGFDRLHPNSPCCCLDCQAPSTSTALPFFRLAWRVPRCSSPSSSRCLFEARTSLDYP